MWNVLVCLFWNMTVHGHCMFSLYGKVLQNMKIIWLNEFELKYCFTAITQISLYITYIIKAHVSEET